MLAGVMRLALLFITQVMNYRGKWNFHVVLLLKVITGISCVIFLVDTSPNMQLPEKRSFILSSIYVLWFQHFIMGLLAPSHANDIG